MKRHLHWVLLAGLLLTTLSAVATAPRIAPQLFGEGHQSDIVGYSQSQSGKADSGIDALSADILRAALEASGVKPDFDLLPSKQLALYALRNGDALAMMGRPQDVSDAERRKYNVVVFLLDEKGGAKSEKIALIIGRQADAAELQKQFLTGLQKIIRNGEYLRILEKHAGRDKASQAYLRRLVQHNPLLKMEAK